MKMTLNQRKKFGLGLKPKISSKKSLDWMWIYAALVVPDNFNHRAGDGTKTRDRHLAQIHPALQASPGTTQLTYVLLVKNYDVDSGK